MECRWKGLSQRVRRGRGRDGGNDSCGCVSRSNNHLLRGGALLCWPCIRDGRVYNRRGCSLNLLGGRRCRDRSGVCGLHSLFLSRRVDSGTIRGRSGTVRGQTCANIAIYLLGEGSSVHANEENRDREKNGASEMHLDSTIKVMRDRLSFVEP